MTIVDFGCGPGGFSLAAARRVGPSGRVYAVDIQPLAIRSVQRAAAKQGLDNIQTMVGDDLDRVAEESVDMALVYDVLHILPKSASVRTIMMAIRRVLKSNGVLSVRDHHLSELSLTTLVTKDGLFEFFGHDRGTFRFEPTGMEGGRP